MVTNVEGDEDRQLERRRRHRSGLNAETLVAALFAITGYRILARRFRTPIGEIDCREIQAISSTISDLTSCLSCLGASRS